MKGQSKMTINLPCFGIIIELGPEDPHRAGAYQGGKITSDLRGGNRLCGAALDAIESLVLAHACAGVDVASPAYIEGIETAVDACLNNLG
jgi:hypothetical protein